MLQYKSDHGNGCDIDFIRTQESSTWRTVLLKINQLEVEPQQPDAMWITEAVSEPHSGLIGCYNRNLIIVTGVWYSFISTEERNLNVHGYWRKVTNDTNRLLILPTRSMFIGTPISGGWTRLSGKSRATTTGWVVATIRQVALNALATTMNAFFTLRQNTK